MTEDRADPAQQPVSTSHAPVVLRIILAILLLVPGLVGIVVLGAVTGAWVYEGFRFLDSDRAWMPLFIIPSVAFILFSVITVGIVLRYARWRRAPQASLVLSIVSIMAIVIGYQLMLDSISADDSESPILTLLAALAGLAIASLPTFLHWWNDRSTGHGG